MAYLQIPIDNTPFCTLSFRVSIKNNTENVSVKLHMTYLDLYDYWRADIYDGDTDELLVRGVPFVLGENILEQYSYIDKGEAYLIETVETGLEQPDNNTLGSGFVLVWGDNT